MWAKLLERGAKKFFNWLPLGKGMGEGRTDYRKMILAFFSVPMNFLGR